MAENDAEEEEGKNDRQVTERFLGRSQKFGQMQRNLSRNKDIMLF